MQPRMHKAYLTLQGHEVDGYTIQIGDAGDWGVSGQLVKMSRSPLHFSIHGTEDQFEVTAVRQDIFRAFREHIQRNELAPDSPALWLQY